MINLSGTGLDLFLFVVQILPDQNGRAPDIGGACAQSTQGGLAGRGCFPSKSTK